MQRDMYPHEDMSGQQWFALTDWGKRYLAALQEWDLGMRKDRPLVEDFKPRVEDPAPRKGPLLPFSLQRKAR